MSFLISIPALWIPLKEMRLLRKTPTALTCSDRAGWFCLSALPLRCFQTVGEGYTQCLEALGRKWGTRCAVGTVRPAVVLADTEETVFSYSTRHQSSLSASQLWGASKNVLNYSDFRISLLLGASISDFRYKNMFVTVQVDRLEVNAEESYVSARILWTVLSTRRRLENAAKWRYFGATLWNEKSRNACRHSMQNLLSFSLLSRNLKIKIYRTIILPVVLYGCETWSLTLMEEIGWGCWEYLGLRETR
jgi:hypothetical protein